MELERRTMVVRDMEVRAADDGEGFTVRGHATTWNDPYPVWDFEEQVDRGAIPDDVQSSDVFAFWSHDSAIPLARTVNGSLTLEKDDVGLAVEFTLPDSRVQEAEAIRTGLVDKMSMGFYVTRQRWEEREDDLPDLRTILEMELLEVSPVAMPANPGTDLSPRMKAQLVEARRKCLGPDCKVPDLDQPSVLADADVDLVADALLARLTERYAERGSEAGGEGDGGGEEATTESALRKARLELAERTA